MPIELPHCTIDLDQRRVRFAEGTAPITTKEAALLAFLAERPNRAVSRMELLSEVWGYSDVVLSRACDSTVRRLRTKIEQDPAFPRFLITVHGEGYMWAATARPSVRILASPDPGPEILALGDREVDLARHTVTDASGASVKLTGAEVALLQRLASAEGRVVEGTTLQRQLQRSQRALHNAVLRLRRKIEPDPATPQFLVTERGSGLRLVATPSVVPIVAPRTPILGRDADLDEVEAHLAAGAIVIVTGPGGVGKSRLAQGIAVRHEGTTWWVDAASATHLDGLIDAVGVTVGAGSLGRGADRLTRLGRVLARRGPGLLVLDNLEQCVASARQLLDGIARMAPEIGILGTSRSRVGLADETCVDLGPLVHDDAVALFEDRARRASRPRRLDDADRASVGRLVTALDGLPLAIELAAAATSVLTPDQILGRLHRLPEAAGQPPRHRTLRAAFAGSFDMLSPEAAEGLLLVAQFTGRFSLEDAEGLLGGAAIDVLQDLRDHSVITSDHAAQRHRFGVLVPLRELAADRRAAMPDAGRGLALRWAAALARRGEPEWTRALFTDAGAHAMADQIAAHDDLVAASATALGWAAFDMAARCVTGALVAVQTEAALAQGDAVWAENGTTLSPGVRGWFGARLAKAHLLFGHNAVGLALADEVLGFVDDPLERASLIQQIAEHHPDRDQRARYYDVAAGLYEAAGRPGRATLVWTRAVSIRGEDLAACIPRLDAALRIGRSSGEHAVLGGALMLLGGIHVRRSELSLAVRRYREAIAIHRAAHFQYGLSATLSRLAEVQITSGEPVAAEATLSEMIQLAWERGDVVSEAIVYSLQVMARTASGDGEGALAAVADCRGALTRSASRPAPHTALLMDYYESLLIVDRDPSSALALAEAVGRAGDELGYDAALHAAAVARALAYLALDRVSEARRAIDAGARQGALSADLPVGASVFAVRGLVGHHEGDPAAAVADLEAADALLRQIGGCAERTLAGQLAARLRACVEAEVAGAVPREAAEGGGGVP